MNDIVIRGNWRWAFLLIFALSFGLNIFSITLFQFRIEYIPFPPPGREVSDAYRTASDIVVAPRTFTVKWADKYFALVEISEEEKDTLEQLQSKK